MLNRSNIIFFSIIINHRGRSGQETAVASLVNVINNSFARLPVVFLSSFKASMFGKLNLLVAEGRKG